MWKLGPRRKLGALPFRSFQFVLQLRVCVPGRMPISGLRPEIGKKSRRKIDFGLTRKIGKESPNNRKNGSKSVFGPFFLFFGDFFPVFGVRLKSIFRRFFSDFGPEARNRHSPRHAYSQFYKRILGTFHPRLTFNALLRRLSTVSVAEIGGITPPCLCISCRASEPKRQKTLICTKSGVSADSRKSTKKCGFGHFQALFLESAETPLFALINVFVIWALRLDRKYTTPCCQCFGEGYIP